MVAEGVRFVKGSPRSEGREQGYSPRPLQCSPRAGGPEWRDAHHWLKGPEYAALRHRLENAHAAVEAALIEARRRVRKFGGSKSRPLAIAGKIARVGVKGIPMLGFRG